jgi:hypothetical protein
MLKDVFPMTCTRRDHWTLFWLLRFSYDLFYGKFHDIETSTQNVCCSVTYSFWWMKSCDGHVVYIRTDINNYSVRKNRWCSPQSSSFDLSTVQVHGIMKTCENSMNIYMIITKCIVDLSLKLSKQWSNVNAQIKRKI